MLVVVRLCTSDLEVVEYFEGLDTRDAPLEILDQLAIAPLQHVHVIAHERHGGLRPDANALEERYGHAIKALCHWQRQLRQQRQRPR